MYARKKFLSKRIERCNMKIKRAFCVDCYEWRNVADLELWEEEPGVMVCDTCGNALVELADEEKEK